MTAQRVKTFTRNFQNLDFLKKPTTVGLMLLSLILISIGLWLINFNIPVQPNAHCALLLLICEATLVASGQTFLGSSGTRSVPPGH
jgi:hypothetical protein